MCKLDLPHLRRIPGKDYSIQRLLIGTHTAEEEPTNNLEVHSVNWPLEAAKISREEAKPVLQEKEKLSLDQQLMHDGEVNKARFMPQSHNVVATKTVSGEVHVFDMYRHPTRPTKGEVQAKPNLRLVGHSQEGFGLSWNPVRAGVVASGANDGQICVWNVGGAVDPDQGN